MANISQLNMGISFDGSDADAGLAKTGKATEDLGKKIEETSKKVKDSEKNSWSNIKAMLELGKSAFRTAKSFTGLVTEAQVLTVRFSKLTGSWKTGVAVLKDLQTVSGNTGVGLGNLASSFMDLNTSGFSTVRTISLLQKAGNLDAVLGGSGAGFQAIVGALSSMNESATASIEIFNTLRKKGLDGTSLLVRRMEELSGLTLSTSQALEMIGEGALLGGTGAKIVEELLNGPEAQQAAERFKGTLAGQLSTLSTQVVELSRDFGTALFKAFPVEKIVAGIKGMVAAVRDIVNDIATTLGAWVDPQGKLQGLEDTFDRVYQITIDIGNALLKAIGKAADMVADMVEKIKKAGILNSAKEAYNSTTDYLALGMAKFWEFAQKPARLGGRTNAGDLAKFVREDMANRGDKPSTYYQDMMRTLIGERRGRKPQDLLLGQQFNPNVKFGPDGMPAGWIEDPAMKAASDAAAEAAKQLNELKISTREWVKENRANVLTPMEEFTKKLNAIIVKEAQFAEMANSREKWDAQMIAGRQKASLISNLIANNSIGTSYLADRATRGSKEEWDTAMRQRFGDQGMNIQERIARALDQSAQIEREQADLQKQLLQAWERVPKPAGVGFMPKGI